MSIFNSLPPKINQIHFIEWLKNTYPFLKKNFFILKKFNSERDLNFLIKSHNSPSFVLKISNPQESKELLLLQDFILDNLNKRDSIKSIIPKKIHKAIFSYTDLLGRLCYVRILHFIEGNMYALVKHNEYLEKSLGTMLGNLSSELKNLNKPAAFRDFEWDPSNILWLKKDLKLFKGRKKNILLKNINEHNFFVQNNKKKLRYSLTHGDVNNFNLVVKKNEVVGLLDYGDMIYAPTINDLAIALSYALMNKNDLYSSLKNIVTAYHDRFKISFDEIFSLMTLVKARLSITVVMAEKQKKKFPNNEYLSISENDAWKLLHILDDINPYLLIFLVRNFCNYQIVENYNKIINFLKKNVFNSILDIDLNKVNKSVIHFNSRSIFTKNYIHEPISLTKKINLYLKKNNSHIGIGLYQEKRNVYQGANYVSLLDTASRRDMHVGIDIFTNVGENIRAPIDGKVYILKDNSFKYDYGPTIILEHKIDKLVKFYTIYGHLSKKCLKNLSLGQIIKKGDVIAQVGNYPFNGNWPPHLHFQIAVDIMGEKNNFPGVSEDILLNLWTRISPDPNLILNIPKTFFNQNLSIDKILSKRQTLVSRNLSISYNKPLQMLEAKNQYFYDDRGKEYLDCVNNISHVGHSHPYVHEAMVKQNLELNTNTRYLYKIMNDYSEKLLSKFPNKLDTIFFVCTGSEANDLAYRIAQTYTGSKDVLVMENAYHGHTNTLIDLSPYKYNGQGGLGKKNYVHVASMPDGIRGKWKFSDKDWLKKYIKQVQETIESIYANNKTLSCFFVESILGCGGQFILPKNYLKEIFKIVRKKNSLCIVDEVQTGFGRVGNNFWAFEEHEVVPDIVTLGKPMGNGHPLAAVVTTKEIANKFNNGMEYFNSFGGNPVSCSVGNAVLEVIDLEKLQQHGLNTGQYFLKSLRKIQSKFPDLISEVRGRGLFIGIDLIKDNKNNPNEKLATLIINKMRDRGILLSTDGPYHNVIKIKPPMPFNKDNSDLVSFELDSLLNRI